MPPPPSTNCQSNQPTVSGSSLSLPDVGSQNRGARHSAWRDWLSAARPGAAAGDVLGGHRPSAWSASLHAVRSTVRRPLHRAVRAFHWRYCLRSLPEKLGLYFHTLDPGQEQTFAEVIGWLKAQGYSFDLPDDFLNRPGRTAYISFDDNHQSWHSALPLMKELGVACTFFVNTCVLRGETDDTAWRSYCRRVCYHGRGQPLARREIREIAQAEHRIGAHTHAHLKLRTCDTVEFEADLRSNRDLLEEITGQGVTNFAFPFGMPRHFPARHLPVARRLGFKTISHATPGMQYLQGDPLALHRTHWNYLLTATENQANLRVDGRRYVQLTGFSPVG